MHHPLVSPLFFIHLSLTLPPSQLSSTTLLFLFIFIFYNKNKFQKESSLRFLVSPAVFTPDITVAKFSIYMWQLYLKIRGWELFRMYLEGKQFWYLDHIFFPGMSTSLSARKSSNWKTKKRILFSSPIPGISSKFSLSSHHVNRNHKLSKSSHLLITETW